MMNSIHIALIITLCVLAKVTNCTPENSVTKEYLEKLFKKYGRDGYLSLEGLEHLLENIGLGGMHFDHKMEQHYDPQQGFVDFHENHDHVQLAGDHDHDHSHHNEHHDSHNHDHHEGEAHDHDTHEGEAHDHDTHGGEAHDHDTHNHEDSHNHDRKRRSSLECLAAQTIYTIPSKNESSHLDAEAFLEICPVLIYQLDSHQCNDPDSSRVHIHEAEDDGKWTAGHKWGYSILACVLISLLSLTGAPLIPLMNKSLYNHMLQFMVALAIGTLSADALLHLIPHALTPHDHSSDAHNHEESHLRSVWLGLTALSGIYVFFVVERVMGSYTTWKRNKKQKAEQATKSNEDQSEDERASKQKNTCEGITLVVHTSKDVRTIANEAHEEVHGHCHTDGQEAFIHSHSNGYHGHSHHGNKIPSSIASVAWMVIVGDGVHNFSDGLAIGAAFSESLSSGLSTSVAVFCHELPHELGDFAVLLTAGMTVKQALFYNFVSAMLSLLGNIIGVALGNLTNITPWVLCLIAGMFLYVALVDMLPELTNMTSKKGESALFHLLLQNIGLITGGAIMLVIAVFEEKIHF